MFTFLDPERDLSKSRETAERLLKTVPLDETQARLVESLQALYTAVVSDILDKNGFRHQVMSSAIRPLWPGAALAGVASTLQVEPCDGPPPAGEEYRLLFISIDSLTPGCVLITSQVDSCIWGELMSEAAILKGGRGIVTDGYVRDTPGILSIGFPTFCKGIDCRDILGRGEVTALDVPIVCGGVNVEPGDFVLGDIDGVVVIPRDAASSVIEEATEKATAENLVREALRNGLSVTDAWSKYGVM